MKSKASVTIVGPGSLGGALAVALSKTGYPVRELVYRGDRRRALKIAQQCGGSAVAFGRASFSGDVVWLCVGDGQIASAAASMAIRAAWKGKYVFHSSGALASAELMALKRRGAQVASVHPMMSFVRSTNATFEGVTFALEGDTSAVRMAARIAEDLQGTSFPLKKADKPLYHALGAFSSPLLIAHLAAAEKIGKKLGLKPEQTRRVIAPILQKTLRNYLEQGPAAALSGPMVRGDVETIRRNLKALKRVPDAEAVYRALGLVAVGELPVKQKAALIQLLSE